MTDILGLGTNAVQVYQRALSTVANNISNLGTEGYTRQVAKIGENQPVNIGANYFGTGARLLGIERQYDEFAERNLRQSTTDHAALAPFISQTQRVLDQMGDVTTGLTSSLDRFFASLRELSTDSHSMLFRREAFNDAEALTQRFRDVDSYLAGSERDSAARLQETVNEINTLAASLAEVNQAMTRERLAANQPSKLLDRRDLLLRELSALVQVQVREQPNGSVDITVGAPGNTSALVEGAQARRLGVETDARRPERVNFVLEPAGRRERVPGVGGGVLGGLVSFREQVLQPTREGLDQLARVLVNEFNSLHRQGLDRDGALGEDFFRLDPAYEIAQRDANRGFAVSAEVVAVAALTGADIELQFDPATQRWSATDLRSGERAEGDENGVVQISGVELRVRGTATSLTTFTLEARQNAAAGMRLAIETPEKLATAGVLRVKPAGTNVTPPDFTLSLAEDTAARSGIAALDERLGNNIHPAAGIDINPGVARPALAIPAGFRDVELALHDAGDAQVQIFTREGRQLIGTPPDEATLAALLRSDNGFADDATYSDVYLSRQPEAKPYLDYSFFEGVRAQPVSFTNEAGFVEQEAAVLRAENRLRLPASMPEGALRLNGEALGELDAESDVATIRAWLQTADPSIEVSIRSELPRVRVADVRPALGLTLSVQGGGSLSISAGTHNSVAGLVNAINDDPSGIRAFIDGENRLVITDPQGRALTLDNDTAETTNALGLPAREYQGVLELRREGGAVELELGESGTPAHLAALGFSSRVYIDTPVEEELLVFVTGPGGQSPRLAATYDAGSLGVLEQLRAREFEVDFGVDHYTVRDVETGTELARRDWVMGEPVVYRGMNLEFKVPPAFGDRFVIDANTDGRADNRTLLSMIALEQQGLESLNGATLGQNYARLTGNVGNLARQAELSEQALGVIREQAEEARDRVSGVNLDEEAADLIRFQQAYQAAARIIQTSQQLFDTIVRI